MPPRGGAYVGEGAIACAFVPAPPCTLELGERVATQGWQIGKVFGEITNTRAEWDITRPLVRVDPAQEHLLYPIARCETTRGRIAASDFPGLSRCTILSPLVHRPGLDTHARNVEPLGLLRIPYGGPDLARYLQGRHGRRRVPLGACLQLLQHIAHGLHKLSRAGLVHHDVKPDNIVLGTRARPGARLIDFHATLRRKDALDPLRNPMLGASYWVHPPEYRMLSTLYERGRGRSTPPYVGEGLATERAIYQVLLDLGQKETLWDQMARVLLRETYEDAYASYANRLASYAQHGENLSGMHSYAARYANRIDIYSLGLVVLYLLSYVQAGPGPLLQDLRALAGEMLSPDPRQRPSPKRLVERLEAMVKAAGTLAKGPRQGLPSPGSKGREAPQQ